LRYLNLVREVRTAAGLSKPKLATRLEKSQNLIAAWELDPKPEEARQLANLAQEAGRPDLATALLVMAGEEVARGEDLLENLRGDERQLAEWVVSLSIEIPKAVWKKPPSSFFWPYVICRALWMLGSSRHHLPRFLQRTRKCSKISLRSQRQ
jgi:transcriptional regulator with XRE-family HTH domain